MSRSTCASCGSEKIIPNLTIVDHGWNDRKHDLRIEMHRDPTAFIFKETQRGILKASVCGDCGNVELSVDGHGKLWEAYQVSKSTP